MQKYLPHILAIFLVTTVICGLVYASVQQNYRQSANDPQIQIVEDLADQLNHGKVPTMFSTSDKVSVERSLAPFVVIYDKSGKPVAGTGQLTGVLPRLPQGVFNFATQMGEDRFTWQPEEGIRAAVVVTPYNTGYVMAGRSMREVEKREEKLFLTVIAAWIMSIVGVAVIYYVFSSVKVLRHKS